MRQNHIRRAEREICAKTRPLDRIQIIEERDGVFSRVKSGGQQATIVSLGVAAFFVVCACGAGFGVVHLLDCGVLERFAERGEQAYHAGGR
jgi:hypothetical protein